MIDGVPIHPGGHPMNRRSTIGKNHRRRMGPLIEFFCLGGKIRLSLIQLADGFLAIAIVPRTREC